ncbi:MAG: AAA domain-containing protein [Candidatus Magasanikbacteria bacterium]
MDNIQNFIKYCLGYVKITRERTTLAQQKCSVNLPTEFFGLLGLLNGDTDGKVGELINLNTFYKYDPNDVPESELDDYEKEKELANKIEDIYNKHRNDQYTKQVILNFGYFEIEIPVECNGDIVSENDQENEEKEKTAKTRIDHYPLFALPVTIQKEISKKGVGEYSLYFSDPEVQVNIGMLELILGEELYFQLLEQLGKYEIEGRLTLPLTDLEVFTEIWHKIKAQLRLKEANFNEKSFALEEMKIALSPKANYFLAEDLAKLSQQTEEDLEKTALISWTQDEELNIENDLPKENDLFFPFPYDKYQLSTLSIIGNKAAIIQGPPGTGKSETISNILCHLAATGKRVLFVSQKAQALKVVKDKLKKLDVKYLFGYIPNPNSAQIGEEDEEDGIAPQLSALGSHIENLGYKLSARKQIIGNSEECKIPSPLDQIVRNKKTNQSLINEIIGTQRKIYQLAQELISIKDYDIEITDFENFSKSFSSIEWVKIKEAKKAIETLDKWIKKYNSNDEKNKFDNIFLINNKSISDYVDAIGKIRKDVAKTGYDRHSNLLRQINNLNRTLRLSGARGKLPREIIDYIDHVLASDMSRNEQKIAMDQVYKYCCYYDNIQQLEVAEDKLKQKLSYCGVSDQEFEIIDEKIDNSSFEELEKTKNKILRVQEIKFEIEELSKSKNLNDVNSALKKAEYARSAQVAFYIQNIINKGIIEKWKSGVTIKQIVRKLASAFGKSKKAFKTFDNLRKDVNNFNAILDLIPVWIMELDDASRIIPLEPGLFDYVILDEASQCNVAYTLPVMYRTNKVLFVGDSEQMRDSTIMFKSNRIFDELAHRYQIPEERQIKATGSAVQSVLDIAYKRGFMENQLRCHYRSAAELIGFSNEYFYKPKGKELIPVNSNYLTYKDTNRVMIIHDVDQSIENEISDSINVAEANAILDLFKELRADERYNGKSIGILSFFNAQATYIRDLFEKEGFKEENDNYKVSIIEGIQGDEKDIIIYSFVIRSIDQKNKYTPLTGEGGDIRADINKGRVNVAFSRARLQIHCFISLPIQEMPERIWLKKYLEYVQDNGEINFYSTDIKPFDSYFEEEFYNLLRLNLKRGYKIQNQVESCGFRIDFVISNLKTGKRLAVECDGPCHFKDEVDEAYGIHIGNDEERQRVLEAAGWKFYRLKYSDWLNDNADRSSYVQEITDLLC